MNSFDTANAVFGFTVFNNFDVMPSKPAELDCLTIGTLKVKPRHGVWFDDGRSLSMIDVTFGPSFAIAPFSAVQAKLAGNQANLAIAHNCFLYLIRSLRSVFEESTVSDCNRFFSSGEPRYLPLSILDLDCISRLIEFYEQDFSGLYMRHLSGSLTAREFIMLDALCHKFGTIKSLAETFNVSPYRVRTIARGIWQKVISSYSTVWREFFKEHQHWMKLALVVRSNFGELVLDFRNFEVSVSIDAAKQLKGANRYLSYLETVNLNDCDLLNAPSRLNYGDMLSDTPDNDEVLCDLDALASARVTEKQRRWFSREVESC